MRPCILLHCIENMFKQSKIQCMKTQQRMPPFWVGKVCRKKIERHKPGLQWYASTAMHAAIMHGATDSHVL